MSTKETIKAYDLFGEQYHNSRKKQNGISFFYNHNLEMPTTLKLLGNVKDKKILDLGCGSGFYSSLLYKKGAKIKGIDLSKTLIKLAKEQAQEVEFKVGDIVKKLPYKNSEFDIVLSSLVLGHLDSWDNVLEEINRILKKNGIFIFSNYNPVTEKTNKKKWFFKTFRVIENYFVEGPRPKIWTPETKNFPKELKLNVMHYHKTYGTIIKLLIKHEFEIIDYEDSFPTKISKEQFPKEYKKSINAPHFCTWKLKKKSS